MLYGGSHPGRTAGAGAPGRCAPRPLVFAATGRVSVAAARADEAVGTTTGSSTSVAGAPEPCAPAAVCGAPAAPPAVGPAADGAVAALAADVASAPGVAGAGDDGSRMRTNATAAITPTAAAATAARRYPRRRGVAGSSVLVSTAVPSPVASRGATTITSPSPS